MTDRTPLVRSTVPGDDDRHRPVGATTGAAPSLRGAPSSSAISSSVAGGTNGDPSSPGDDVEGKTVLLMAKHDCTSRQENERSERKLCCASRLHGWILYVARHGKSNARGKLSVPIRPCLNFDTQKDE